MFNMFNEKMSRSFYIGFFHHLWEVDSHFLPPKKLTAGTAKNLKVWFTSDFPYPLKKKGVLFLGALRRSFFRGSLGDPWLPYPGGHS